MDAPRLLLVDDDADLGAMLREYLEGEGFAVEIAANGALGAERALSGEHDAVILDVMLPRLGGMEALRRIRQSSRIPILMLTARGDQVDRVVGLELGADDYIPKPCYPRELVARLRAVLRRQDAGWQAPPVLAAGGLEVQVAARRALWAGQGLDLTLSEFNMLVALLRAGQAVATRDDLSQQVLGRPRRSYDRSVDVHVGHLRQKLEAASGGAASIETVRGIGYRLEVR